MNRRNRVLALCLSLLLLLSLCPAAEAADDKLPQTMYIGLSFGEEAKKTAVLTNYDRGGFALGHMDGERRFVKEDELSCSVLRIGWESVWYMLLDESYPGKAEAEAAAKTLHSRVLLIDGAYRTGYGPYASPGEVAALLRQSTLPARALQQSGLSVYDENGRAQLFYPGRDTLAVQALSDGQAITEFNGRRYRGAFLLRCGEDERLTVINAVALEDYVKGVVPYEMNAGWPLEALKAQAVCARTYAAYNLNAYAEVYGFDLTNDTRCQVYRGMNGADPVTDAAVDETRGQCVRYRGELCEIYYFSSDGGATEDGVNIFGSDQPYLKGKKDPYEAAMDRYVLRWSRRFSGEEIAGRLRSLGYEIGTVKHVVPVVSGMGNVIAMRYFDGEGGCVFLKARDSYSFLALDSARFRVKKEKGVFLFSGIGWGHNCGMSQWGAYAMADAYGMSAEDIIEFYFTGARIE